MTQEEAGEILKTGASVFLTGSAGSGKTYLLNEYIKYLKKNNIETGVTASTGIAATHLNGRTIHSWCGIGIKQSMNKTEIKKVLNKKRVWERIRYARTLIIDEISMLNASRFDLISKICSNIRQDMRPFGGMQVVLCGDFFQLPPVTKTDEDDGRFIIESDTWQRMDIKICYLEGQFRQDDKRFLQLLNDIRGNKNVKNALRFLEERLNSSVKFSIRPTKLDTHNINVDAYNDFELNKLKEKEVIFSMNSNGVEQLVKDLNRYCLAPEILKVKVGAVVMFVRNNFDKGYVNGTLGKVIGYDKDSDYPIVETVNGKVIIAFPETWSIDDDEGIIASIGQVPLRLAWAITVHKSQGMSLDCAEIDLSRTFEYGMGYVALSRVRSLAGMKLVGINEMALEVNTDVVELDKVLYEKSKKDIKEFNKLKSNSKMELQQNFIEDKEPASTVAFK